MYKWLIKTKHVKIKNPITDDDTHSYDGPIENYELNNYQTELLLKINISLHQFHQEITHIIAGTRNVQDRSGKETEINPFVASNKDGNIYWIKYQDKNSMNYRNYMYVNDTNIITKKWLALNDWERAEIYNK
jgi:hypothetical protein